MRLGGEASKRPDQTGSSSPLAPDPAPLPVSTTDAYAPAQIADRVCKIGLVKVTMPVPTMIALAVLAGAFISLGALFYTVTVTTGPGGAAAPFGLARLAGGLTFSLGLILVVGGAELFTGNNLIAMVWPPAACRRAR